MNAEEDTTRLVSSKPLAMVVGPNHYGMSLHPSSSSSSIMLSPSTSAGMMQQNHQLPYNQVVSPVSRPSDPSNSTGFHVEGLRPSGFTVNNESAKKKRGRPRKYGPNGSIAGSAPGQSNNNHDERAPDVGFTPHIINVKAGEDVASKIMDFCQKGSRTVCILSANGAICNVTLRQPATSGGTVTYEGRFEIISLSGSFLLMEYGGSRSRTGGLSVSLAGSDGRVLGGGVAGMLMAAGPVQVIVGSFIPDGKKPNSERQLSLVPAHQVLGIGAPIATGSPPSQGASSESSEEPDSPLNHRSGAFNNTGHPIQNFPTFSTMGWCSYPADPH